MSFHFFPVRQACSILLFLVLLAVPCLATEFRIQSDTMLKSFERNISANGEQLVVPGYQYLGLDLGQLQQPGLSLHAYGWGRADLADSGFFDETSDGELLYGYLQYTRPVANQQVRLGRFQVFAGVANESIDGLEVRSDLGPLLDVALFGGQEVGLISSEGRSGDQIYGGRLGHHLGSRYNLGVSYKRVDNHDDVASELAGVDLAAFANQMVSLYGVANYNLHNDTWSEQDAEVHIDLGPWSIRPGYGKLDYAGYFGKKSEGVNPFAFLARSGEELTNYRLVVLRQGETWDASVSGRHYLYELADSSDFLSTQLSWHDGQKQVGGEIGYMHSEAAANNYALFRLFASVNQLRDRFVVDSVSSDLQVVSYSEPIDGADYSLFAALGCVREINKQWALRVTGDYSKDPLYDSDLRALLTLSYRDSGVF